VAAPVLSILIGGAAMRGYRLTEQRHKEIRDGLAAREGADAAEPEAVTVSGPMAPAAVVEG
jgi:Na+/melibiose symporter-like transporter